MNTPRRLGVLGGTFDPIHFGHLHVAHRVVDVLGLDHLYLLPAGDPWQKHGRVVASARDRCAMAEAACRDDPVVSVSREEVNRPGPTYSIDTVRALREAHPLPAQIFFILGTDAAALLPGWKDATALAEQVRIVAVARPGSEPPAAGLPLVEQILDVDAPDISSSRIRADWAAGNDIRAYVPEAVAAYIHAQDVYPRLPPCTETSG